MVLMKRGFHVYECHAYICVDSAHHSYPIALTNELIDRLKELKDGDFLSIKGLGLLQIVYVTVDGYNYSNKGKQGLYEEIAVSSIRVSY